jgi:ubiquinol-cytochrome c reductase iron-sulfur subunit
MANAPRSKRRDFLVAGATAFVSAGALAAVWPLVASLAPNAASVPDFIDVDLSNLEPRQTRTISLFGKPVLVRRWSLRDPWIATAADCAHCACLLKFDGAMARPAVEALFCPCCASRFDFVGRRLAGPARSDLVPVDTEVQPGNVVRLRAARRS